MGTAFFCQHLRDEDRQGATHAVTHEHDVPLSVQKMRDGERLLAQFIAESGGRGLRPKPRRSTQRLARPGRASAMGGQSRLAAHPRPWR
jgi:hypothetical protein